MTTHHLSPVATRRAGDDDHSGVSQISGSRSSSMKHYTTRYRVCNGGGKCPRMIELPSACSRRREPRSGGPGQSKISANIIARGHGRAARLRNIEEISALRVRQARLSSFRRRVACLDAARRNVSRLSCRCLAMTLRRDAGASNNRPAGAGNSFAFSPGHDN